MEFTPGTPYKVGDRIIAHARPPFDLLDKITWALFRWTRYRAPVRREYIVTKNDD